MCDSARLGIVLLSVLFLVPSSRAGTIVVGGSTATFGTPSAAQGKTYSGVGTNQFQTGYPTPGNVLRMDGQEFRTPTGRPFVISELTYTNAPTWFDRTVDSVPVRIDLNFGLLEVSDSSTPAVINPPRTHNVGLDFSFEFTMTPNLTGGAADDDFLYPRNVFSRSTFTARGKQYRLALAGFSDDGGRTVRGSFRLPEDQTTSSKLFAIVTPASAPEPNPRVTYSQIPGRSPGAKGLVFITHGWNSDAGGWVNDMAEAGRGQIDSAEWDIVAYDWSPYADLEFFNARSPATAATNAMKIGSQLGDQLRHMGYERIHFAGHSAGSWLIDAASDVLRASDDQVAIHSTFLDAYTPLGLVGVSELGDTATFSEHYVDRRGGLYIPGDLLSTTAHTLVKLQTNATLQNAFNVDVTDLDESQLRLPFGVHAWPYEWYLQSISSHGSGSPSYGWGFQISQEYNNGNIPSGGKGSRITLPDGARVITPPSEPTVMYTEPIEFSPARSIISETGHVLADGGSVTLTTGSPAWIMLLVDLEQPTNLLSFDYEFLSDAEGWFSVAFDDQILFEADERYSIEGVNFAQLALGDDYEPGQYLLSFRLDPYTEQKSMVNVWDVRFGHVQLEAPPPIPLPPAAWMAVLTGAIGIASGRWRRLQN